MGDHVRECYGVHRAFRGSTLIDGAGVRDRDAMRVFYQLPVAANSLGGSNIERVAIGGNAKHDLVCREAGSDPSIETLDRRASREVRASITQRRVGPNSTSGPLGLCKNLLGVHLCVKRGYPH